MRTELCPATEASPRPLPGPGPLEPTAAERPPGRTPRKELGQDDLDEAGNALQPGNAAAILVYENRWAAPFARALRRSGAQMVAGGRIPVQAILASLDAEDAAETGLPPQ